MGHFAGIELAKIVRSSGRLYGAFGPRGEYAFDSNDLNVFTKMLCAVSDYVSEEAFTWQWRMDMENSLTAHVRLDSLRLLEDLEAGASCIMRENRMEIEQLLARYTPWMTLIGIEHAEQITWEHIYRTLKEQLSVAREAYANC